MSRENEVIDPAEAGCRLFLISPPRLALDVFAADLDAALAQGGCAAFLLRLEADRDVVRQAAAHLHPVCRQHGIAFLLAGDLALAQELSPDGLHVSGPADVRPARAALGEECILGAACASRHAAMVAGEAGADYIAFSAEHGAQAWPDVLDLVAWWSAIFVLPCLGLGAKDGADCAALKRAGADFVGVSDAVWQYVHGPAAGVIVLQDALRAA